MCEHFHQDLDIHHPTEIFTLSFQMMTRGSRVVQGSRKKVDLIVLGSRERKHETQIQNRSSFVFNRMSPFDGEADIFLCSFGNSSRAT
jgi:hypothetical protein